MSHDKQPLPLEIAKLIDQRCDAYEADSLEGQPSIEAYLEGFPEQWIVALLENLVSLDMEIRLKRGEQVSIEQYRSRFPQLNLNPGSWDKTRTVAQFRKSDSTLGFDRAGSSVGFGRLHYFGDYELLEVCGRGGMGTVFRARQVTLGRIVAVKMLNEGLMESAEAVSRFQVEASAAAQLDHPNIVPVYEVGQQDGRHFFSMAYVEGLSLAERLRDGPFEPRDAARMLALICRAVHFAHQRGIVHRDLKPSNIMLDQAGVPKVSDFGLAKFISEATGLTVTGEVLGTPCYMSPEQASGKIKQQTHLSDVYSLGAILYCCLSGRPPFQAASSVATMKQVLESEPVALRVLNSSVPRDLETISHRCLQKEPTARYATALAVAEDLQRYLEGRPILARPISLANKFYRWCRRNPAQAANMTIVLGVALCAALIWIWISNREKRLEAIAETQKAVHELVVAASHEMPAQVERIRQRGKKDPHLSGILSERWKELELTQEFSLGMAVVLQDREPKAIDRVCSLWLDSPWSLWPWLKQQLPRDSQAAVDWIKNQNYGDLESLSQAQLGKLAVLNDWLSTKKDSAEKSELENQLEAWIAEGKLLKTVVEEFARDQSQLDGLLDACEPFRAQLVEQVVKNLDYRTEYLTVYGAMEARLLQGLWRDKTEWWIEYGWLVHRNHLHLAFEFPLKELSRELLRTHIAQPMPKEATWDQRQRWRRSKAVIATVLLADGDPLWSLLEYDSDPSVAAFIVDFLPRFESTHRKIEQQLVLHLKQRTTTAFQPNPNVNTPELHPVMPNPWLADTASARLRNLLLMVGNYPAAECRKLVRMTLREELLELYRSDPDPGVHAASGWLLTKDGMSLDKLQEELKSQDGANKSGDQAIEARVNKLGWRLGPNHHVMIDIQGPVSFVAGAAVDDPNRDANDEINPATNQTQSWSLDRPHQKRIPRSYQIGMHETQFGQVEAFDDQFHEVCNISLSPEFHYPACKVSWELAAKYCNWLSQRAGIERDQWCFIEQGSTIVPARDYLHRTGYRLPTEAEWEWACRAATTTSRFFGDEAELLQSYAWYARNSLETRHSPAGAMKPNGLGLFETLGNVAEWCMDSYSVSNPGTRDRMNDVEQNNPRHDHRILKGDSSWSNARDVRVSEYSNFNPTHREGNTGFRIARTIESFDTQDK